MSYILFLFSASLREGIEGLLICGGGFLIRNGSELKLTVNRVEE